MLSPNLLRYVIDPENPKKEEELKEKVPVEKLFKQVNMVDFNGINEDCTLLRTVLTKIKRTLTNNDKNVELSKQD